MMDNPLFSTFAAAYVRGEALRAQANGGHIRSMDTQINGRSLALPSALLETPLDSLTETDIQTLLQAGRSAGLKLYRFKRRDTDLPRVKRVLGILRALNVETLLDVGSGRGVFLWPCLNAFAQLGITSLDVLPGRVEFLQTTAQGGLSRLHALQADICSCPVASRSFDAVTMLEVLEHIPDAAAAVRQAVRIARRHVVVSVPSKPDDNPEHLHLFTREALCELFTQAGCARVSVDGVLNHWVAVATLEENPHD